MAGLRPPAVGADEPRVWGVLVIDDHPVMRAGITSLIREAPDLKLLGEAADGAEGLTLIQERRPDVAIVDYRMPELDGLALCEALRDEPDAPRVLLLSAADDPALVQAALEAGAAGFLGKDESDEAIRSAIHRVLAGETVLSPTLQAALVTHLGKHPNGPAKLSDNERLCLELVAEGLSNAEIAARLTVSQATVKSYLARAFTKLGVNDRAAAAAEAVRRGLIS